MEKNTKEKKFDKAKEAKREKDRKFKEKQFKDKLPIYRQGPNDPSWRTGDSVLTKLAASLPFGLPAGLEETITDIHASVPSASGKHVQPGIMNIEVYLTGGSSADYNSPANLCFRRIYSFVRHANSGSKNYEAADLGVYFMSIAQVLGLLGWCQRTLRLVNEYSLTNRYTPKMLLSASWVDFDDLLSHQADLKYLISWLGKAVGSLAFPDMPYFKACYEAFKYIYRDNDSPKEQFYMLHPKGFGVYDPVYTTNGGGMKYSGTAPWGNALSALKMTFTDIRDYVFERMNILLGDEDCGIISGDILKAFQGKGLFVPEAFSLDYDVVMHSPEFLQQIHNLTLVDENCYSLLGYKQNPGTPNTAPFVEMDATSPGSNFADAVYLCSHTILDAFSKEPDPAEVVNCTVLNPQIKVKMVGANQYNYDVSTAVYDLFLPVSCYVFDDLSGTTVGFNALLWKKGSNVSAINDVAYNIGVLTNFDWHPLSWRMRPDSRIYAVGDIQNARIFDYNIGKRIHENSMLNLLNFSELNFYK